VTLDGSKAAASAIPAALELARAFEAPLILLRVVPVDETDERGTQRDHDAQRLQAETYLDSPSDRSGTAAWR
jgi:hypothetical protein